MIIVLDDKVYNHRCVRSLQFTDAAELTTIEDSNGVKYAKLNTDCGELECKQGTTAVSENGQIIKRLTSTGWVNW